VRRRRRCASAVALRTRAVEDRQARELEQHAPDRRGALHDQVVGTLGTTALSTYSASPLLSAARVLTQGMPAVRSCAAASSCTVLALAISWKASRVRRCSALASRSAKKLAGVQPSRISGASSTKPSSVR
jgi:cobalamin synthase